MHVNALTASYCVTSISCLLYILCCWLTVLLCVCICKLHWQCVYVCNCCFAMLWDWEPLFFFIKCRSLETLCLSQPTCSREAPARWWSRWWCASCFFCCSWPSSTSSTRRTSSPAARRTRRKWQQEKSITILWWRWRQRRPMRSQVSSTRDHLLGSDEWGMAVTDGGMKGRRRPLWRRQGFFVFLRYEGTAKGGTLDPTAFCNGDIGTFTKYFALHVLNLDLSLEWSSFTLGFFFFWGLHNPFMRLLQVWHSRKWPHGSYPQFCFVFNLCFAITLL